MVPVYVPVDWHRLPSLGSGARFDIGSLPGRLTALHHAPWVEFDHAARCEHHGLANEREPSLLTVQAGMATSATEADRCP